MMEERRNNYAELNSRIAAINTRLSVLESQTQRGREDTQEILAEIKVISCYINEIRPRVDCIEGATPEVRLTRLESNQRHFGIVLALLFSIAAFKDYIWNLIKTIFE